MPRRSATGIRGLYRTKDGEWRIDYRWRDPKTGEMRRYAERLELGTTATAAKNRTLTIINAAAAGTFNPKQEQPKRLDEALKEYEKWAIANRPRSLASKKAQIKVLKKHLGADTKLDDLSPFAVERFKSLRSKTSAAATVNRGLATIKHAVGLFAEWGWMRETTAIALRKVKLLKEPPGRTREYTPDEETKLLAELPSGVRALVQVALLTGMRREEAALLRRDQVNLGTREITLTRTKNNRVRILPINDSAAAVLKQAMGGRKSEYVFLSQDGRPYEPDSVTKAFGRARRAAGLKDVRFHDSRHTCMGRLRRGGVQLDVLQDLGGWQSMAMVRRYSNIGKRQLHEAVAVLDRPVADPLPQENNPRGEIAKDFKVVKCVRGETC